MSMQDNKNDIDSKNSTGKQRIEVKSIDFISFNKNDIFVLE